MAGIPRTIPEILRKAIGAALADVHVAVPGKVVSYDPAKGLADVEIQVQHSVWDDDGNRTYEDIGTLPGVPVRWQRAGGFVITMPLVAGDTGQLLFNSDAIGEWRASNQKSQPDDASRLSIGWPTFSPDLAADSNPLASADVTNRTSKMVVGEDGGNTQIILDKTTPMILIHKDATDFVAMAAKVMSIVNAITGTTIVPGDGGAAIKAAVAAAVTALGAGGVGASKTKAK